MPGFFIGQIMYKSVRGELVEPLLDKNTFINPPFE